MSHKVLPQLFRRPPRPQPDAAASAAVSPVDAVGQISVPVEVHLPPRPVLKVPESPRGVMRLLRPGLNGTRRLAQALNAFNTTAQQTHWCDVDLRDDDVRRWKVMFFFPEGRMAHELAWYGLTHCTLHIDFPEDYPTTAPHVRVMAPQITNVINGEAGVYGGALCLEFLHNWNPSTQEEQLLSHLHHALSTASIVDGATYTERQAREGEAYIRRVHTDWRPMNR